MITCKDGRVLAAQLRALIGAPSDLFYGMIWLWPAPKAPPSVVVASRFPQQERVVIAADYGDGCINVQGFGYHAVWWRSRGGAICLSVKSGARMELESLCCACEQKTVLINIKDGCYVCRKCHDDPRVTFTTGEFLASKLISDHLLWLAN